MPIEILKQPSALPAGAIPSCGDLSCELLVDPIPRPDPAPITINLRPRRRRVVMQNNWKPNSYEILVRAKVLLEQRGIEVAEISAKATAATPMSARLFDELSGEEGLVLLGISDCGSCSASSAVDSIVLQTRGVVALAMLTEPFKDQITRAMAYQPADRDLPAIVLPHPMQNVSEFELDRRAELLAHEVERYLDDAQL